MTVPDTLLEQAAILCRGPVRTLTPLPRRGRNNRVYRVDADAGTFALKAYPEPVDGRDRLTVEFKGLHFLSSHGISALPRPVASAPELRLALYEWIEGAPPQTSQDAVDQASRFLLGLHALREAPDAAALPFASEACFSPAEILRQIEFRRIRLFEQASDPRMMRWLETAFDPVFSQVIDRVRQRHQRDKVSFDEECLPEGRTLSPSDFGFHNALCGTDGQLVFLDFEYFGWDDPVKLIADVCLHPGMELPPALAARFRTAMLVVHGEQAACRLDRVFPLYALRWSMILLNEFLPHGRFLRSFAGVAEQEEDELRCAQLEKADRMARRALELAGI